MDNQLISSDLSNTNGLDIVNSILYNLSYCELFQYVSVKNLSFLFRQNGRTVEYFTLCEVELL